MLLVLLRCLLFLYEFLVCGGGVVLVELVLFLCILEEFDVVGDEELLLLGFLFIVMSIEVVFKSWIC